jgi:hypothetical protein
MLPGKLEKPRPLPWPIIRVTIGSCEKVGTMRRRKKKRGERHQFDGSKSIDLIIVPSVRVITVSIRFFKNNKI